MSEITKGSILQTNDENEREEIKNAIKFLKEVIKGAKRAFGECGVNQEKIAYYYTAVKVLEKQIPKKPVDKNDYYDFCPVCDSVYD